jgi:hypothetical protein
MMPRTRWPCCGKLLEALMPGAVANAVLCCAAMWLCAVLSMMAAAGVTVLMGYLLHI